MISYALFSINKEKNVIKGKEITNLEEVKNILTNHSKDYLEIIYYTDIDTIFILNNFKTNSRAEEKYTIRYLVSYNTYKYSEPAPLLYRIVNAAKEFLNTYLRKGNIEYYVRVYEKDFKDNSFSSKDDIFDDKIEIKEYQADNYLTLEELRKQFIKEHPEIVKAIKYREKAEEILVAATEVKIKKSIEE